MPIVGRYHFTECAKKAIDYYYSSDADPALFLKNQRILQGELIRCHFAEMDDATKARAAKTLRWIDFDTDAD